MAVRIVNDEHPIVSLEHLLTPWEGKEQLLDPGSILKLLYLVLVSSLLQLEGQQLSGGKHA